MASDNLNHRVVSFPTRSDTNTTEKLLKAAKLTERAITLALGCNVANRNTVVRLLRIAIEEAEHPKPPSGPAAQRQSRCEAMRSDGHDSSGERAVECRAPADLECEECGFLCWGCAEEHAANYSDHHASEIVALARAA